MPAKVANIVYEQIIESAIDLSVDLLTPAEDGVFRLSLFGNMDSTGFIGITHTDELGSKLTGAATEMTTSGHSRASLVTTFKAVAGQPIHLSTTMDSFPFSLSVVVEQLQ